MLILILFLAVGSVLAYIARQNFTHVTLTFGTYVLPNIPLFYVIVASLLVGLSLSYIIYLVNSFKSFWIIRNKESIIKQNQDEILELTKRVHQLELEIKGVRDATGLNPDDPKSM